MSSQDDSTRDSTRSYAERWAAESFLSEATVEHTAAVHPWYQAYTPFSEEQEQEEVYGLEAEEEDFSAELEDEESEEAGYELIDKASELHPEHYSTELQDERPDVQPYEMLDEASELELYQEPVAGEDEYPITQSGEAERLPQEHFESLVGEAKALLDEMASASRHYGVAVMSEAEIEAFLDRYQPVGTQLPQGFEYLLDDVRDTAKRVLKGAISLTKLQTSQARLQSQRVWRAFSPRHAISVAPRRRAGVARGGSGQYGEVIEAQVIEGLNLGIAVWQTGQQILTSGDIRHSAVPASYIHQNTPGNVTWSHASLEFPLLAYHPRLFIGEQRIWYRLEFDYNGYDVRNATVVLLDDRSSRMYSSDFEASFIPLPHTPEKETVAKIMFNIQGRWDPVGRGVTSFTGGLLVSATPQVTLEVRSERRGWVHHGTFTNVRWTPSSVPAITALWEVFFAPGSDRLEERSERGIVDWYRRLPHNIRQRAERGGTPIVLHGYASTTRGGPYNRELSRRRAEHVQRILQDVAGTGARFEVFAHGEYDARTSDRVESREERRVRMEVHYTVGE